MDDVTRYRQIIKDTICHYAQFRPSRGDVQNEVLFDEQNDQYVLIHSGWIGPRRVHGSLLHLAIRDGQVWIEHDGMEEGVANDLVEAGIPRDRIVLGFKPPEIRPLTDFAVA